MFEMCQMNEMIINLKTKCSYFQKYFFYLCFIYLNKSVCVCMFMCSCFFSLLLSVYQTGTGLSAPWKPFDAPYLIQLNSFLCFVTFSVVQTAEQQTQDLKTEAKVIFFYFWFCSLYSRWTRSTNHFFTNPSCCCSHKWSQDREQQQFRLLNDRNTFLIIHPGCY